MLTQLQIRNFALIEEQTINFGSGLNVISGETGSGKSMVLQALLLVLGAKPKPNILRVGASTLEVIASFDLTKLPKSIVSELPDIAQGDELNLVRSLNSEGKGKVYINGRVATLTLLQEIVPKLINICGQSQYVRLLEESYHLGLVDDFAKNHEVLARYRENYDLWRAKLKLIKESELASQRQDSRFAELTEIVSELASLNLYAGKRAELETEVRKLSNVEHLISGAQEISQGLEGEAGPCEELSKTLVNLVALSRLDPSLAKLVELVQSAKVQLDEFSRELRTYASNLNLNDEKLAALRDELAELARLERKYHTDAQGLAKLVASAKAELASFSSVQSLDGLRQEAQAIEETLTKQAKDISQRRSTAGNKLARQVEQELTELNMQGARFALKVEEIELRENGKDKLEFLISTNPGQPLMALKHVASGGELSRIMLVLKKVLEEQSGVNVLVFDEVDTGISGGVARAVGEKLLFLARNSQVICITHLAQVASLATHHFRVDKTQSAKGIKSTISIISELTDEEKVEEIARMLAGYTITKASRESAKELLSSKIKE